MSRKCKTHWRIVATNCHFIKAFQCELRLGWRTSTNSSFGNTLNESVITNIKATNKYRFLQFIIKFEFVIHLFFPIVVISKLEYKRTHALYFYIQRYCSLQNILHFQMYILKLIFGCQLHELYGFPGDHQPDATMRHLMYLLIFTMSFCYCFIVLFCWK